MTDKFKARCDQLFGLEMMFNGKEYAGTKDYNKDFNVHHTEIQCETDEEWNKIIARLEKELEIRKEKHNATD